MTTQIKLDAKTSAEIETGKFSSNYLIYNRKSTDEAENQKSSLNYQRSENTRFANRERLSIAPITLPGLCTNGVVSEKHSGFKEDDTLWITDAGEVRYRIDRPKFQLLVQHLNKEHFKGLICLSWDRISRNRGDDTIVRKLMRKGVDIRFVYANYDDSSAGELHMDIDGMFAQHHSRVTSEKIRLATRSQRAKGKCTYRAPIGYLNLGNVEDKPQDPERAPIIKELFELYATGDWSLSDLARHARKQGLKTVAMRPKRTRSEILADDDADEDKERPKVSRPVGQSLISRVLNNPFYTGKVVGPDGIYVDSTCHEAIIDEGTFELVQSMLGKKNVSVHYTKKLDHPLRGMVRCRLCNRVYSPYLKKGILYFYARCAPGCKNSTKSCNSQFLSDKIYKLLKTLSFSTDELAAIDARISTEITLLEERRATETARSERSKKRIREDLAYLRTNQLTLLRSGTYEPGTLLDERTRLEHELDQLQSDEQISEAAMRDLMKVVIRVSELLNNTAELYRIADPYDKEQITKAIFSELFLANNTLTYKAQTGLEALFNQKSALGAPREWLSELHGKKKYLLELTEILDLMAK